MLQRPRRGPEMRTLVNSVDGHPCTSSTNNVIEFYLRLVAKRIAPHRKPRQQSPPPGMYVRATYTERDAARRALRGLENTHPSPFSPSKLQVRTYTESTLID